MPQNRRFPIIFLTILLALGGLPQPAIPATPPASGDWDITTDTVVDNVTATLDGNLTVHSGATLTVLNSNLSFNYSGPYWNSYPLLVEEGATLELKGTTIAPAGQARAAYLDIRGCATIADSILNSTWIDANSAQRCNVTACRLLSGGISTDNSNTTVRDCTFIMDPDWGGPIGVTGGNVTISGCFFFCETELAIELPPLRPSVGLRPNTTCINNNLFSDIGDMPIYMETTSQGPGNQAPATIFVEIESGAGLLIERNIFSKFRNGIAVYNWDWETAVPAVVSNNSFRGSWVGVLAYNQEDCSFTNNSFFGTTVGLDISGSGREIFGNLFQDNKWGMVCQGGAYQNISGNDFQNCSVGIAMQATLNNTVAGNDFAACKVSVCHNTWSYLPYSSEGLRMTGNRISNGTLGANLTYFSGEFSENEIANCTIGADITNFSGIVSENRISNCTSRGLVAWDRATPGSELAILGNTLENCGLFLADRSNRTVAISGNAIIGAPNIGVEVLGHANITNNRISASAAGVRVAADSYDRSGSVVSANTFGGISGFCVHAIGTAIGTALSPANNSYPKDCAGRLLQEWWLQLYVIDGAGRLVPDASVSVSGAAGGPARNWTGSDLLLNASEYLVDNAGEVVPLNPNLITAEKPGTGIGRERVNVTENAWRNLTLRPRPDLYFDVFQVESGRLQPARTVMAQVIVGVDRTYLPQKTQEISVKVLLKADGQAQDSEYVTIPGTGAFGSHRFWWTTQGGTHTLSVVLDPDDNIAEYDEGNNQRSEEVQVNAPPVAALNVSTLSARAGENITFSAESSTDDVLVKEYIFHFGDGMNTGWIENSNVAHFYSRAGSYNATVQVRDGEGALCERAAVVRLSIAPYPPEVTLDAESTVIGRGELVRFTAVIANPNMVITGINWDFGDGKSESGLEASTGHIYLRSGVFTATVTVQDSEGQRGSSSLLVVVQNKLPTASLTFSPQNCTIETEVAFTSRAKDPDGNVINRLWQFGDGTCSTEAEPRHRFPHKGNFTVTLTVQDDSGDWSAPADKIVRVGNLAPCARAKLAPLVVGAGEPVTFYATCSTDPDDPFCALVFCWSSADGWQAAGLSAQRTFASPGRHTIRLAVLDPEGAVDFTEVVVTVKPDPATGSGPSGAQAAVAAIALLAVAVTVLFYLRRFGRLRPGQ